MKSLLYVCLFSVLGLASPVSIVSQGRDSLTVEFEFQPKWKTVQYEGVTYLQLLASEWENYSELGSPVLPAFRIPLYLAPGKSLSWEILSVERTPTTQLSHPISFQFDRMLHNGQKNPVKKDSVAYTQSYGKELLERSEEGYAANDYLVFLKFHPVSYDSATNQFSHVKKARVKLSFLEGRHLSRAKATVSGVPGQTARLLAWNQPPESRSAVRDSKVDLVIAHSSYKESLKRYLTFKRMMGRKIRAHYIDGKNNSAVKEIIKTEYATTPAPNNTFLVGSIDQLPSWKGSSDNTWSDYEYQKLDSDSVPDIALGRLPANNSDELLNWVDKAIKRELENKNVDEVLLTAGRDTNMGCPNNVTKVGEKIKVGSPQIRVTKKYRTEVDTNDVIDGYNQSPNIIVYDGHGNRQGMQEIPLTIPGVSGLTNTVFPIILDIACLNANWTSSGAAPRNFAETILLESKKGAAGILASGGSGYGHDFFQTIGATMAQGRLEPSNTKLNEIGQVILVSKIKHDMQDRSYWNYYGDPASSVW